MTLVAAVKQYLLRLAGALLLPAALYAIGGVGAMVVFVVIGFSIYLLFRLGPGWAALLILLGISA